MSDMLIKLVGDLSRLKYIDERFNQMNIQYSIRAVRGKTLLEGVGIFNNVPIKITIHFNNIITSDEVKVAYNSLVKILKMIHINTKLVKQLSSRGINNNLMIDIEIRRNLSVKYNVISPIIQAYHYVNFVEKESVYNINMSQEITDNSILKAIIVLLTNPIRIYDDSQLIRIRKVLYNLSLAFNGKNITLKHKFNTNNVVITIKSRNFVKRSIIKFDELIMNPSKLAEKLFK